MLLVDLLMYLSVNRCDQLERGRCYQCIGAVIEEGCPAEALNVNLKLTSCWNPLPATTLQVFHIWFKAGNVPEKEA